MGLSPRAEQRWRLQQDGGDDRRRGPKSEPPNKLSAKERRRVLKVANLPAYRDLPPAQIVARLADTGQYVASEATFHRVLKDARQNSHRSSARPPRRRPLERCATGPLQQWAWDITYLKANVRGMYYRLYLVEDLWSRKIVGWAVECEENSLLAAALLQRTSDELGVDLSGLVLHSDNGGPMKGSTMVAKMQQLGVIPSFSRPAVSDDNPFPEALFRTLKYRPWYPSKPFASLEEARQWVAGFVHWYNHEHLHSGIGYVAPAQRHSGEDKAILDRRRRVYERARQRHPNRWSRHTRSWDAPQIVRLNSQPEIRHQAGPCPGASAKAA